MAELDLEALEAQLTPHPGHTEPEWDYDDAQRWLHELIALCREQRDYLREKNDIIKAYAGVEAALRRLVVAGSASEVGSVSEEFDAAWELADRALAEIDVDAALASVPAPPPDGPDGTSNPLTAMGTPNQWPPAPPPGPLAELDEHEGHAYRVAHGLPAPPGETPRESFEVIRPLAYRGKEGCTSPLCTRLDIRDTTGPCYGWHCAACDEPCSYQGHENCPGRAVPAPEREGDGDGD